MNIEGAPEDAFDSTIVSVTSGSKHHGDLELHFPAGSFTPESIQALVGKAPDDAPFDSNIEPATNMWGEVLNDPNTLGFLTSLGTAVVTSSTYDILKHMVVQAFENYQEQALDSLPDDEEMERIARQRIAVREGVAVHALKLIGLADEEDGTKTVILKDEQWKYTLTFRASKGGALMVSYAKDLV